MLNEESFCKIRELGIEELVDILDDQVHRLNIYISIFLDDWIFFCYRRNLCKEQQEIEQKPN